MLYVTQGNDNTFHSLGLYRLLAISAFFFNWNINKYCPTSYILLGIYPFWPSAYKADISESLISVFSPHVADQNTFFINIESEY